MRCLYIGEMNDYSDNWIVNKLEQLYEIRFITPGELLESFDSDTVMINRMYASARARYLSNDIVSTLKALETAEKQKLPIINSANAYAIEEDRMGHSFIFSRVGLRFLPLHTGKEILNNFPYVLKKRDEYRNTKLRIICSAKDLREVDEQAFLQELVQDKDCYRTEFIGKYNVTFRQVVTTDFAKKELSFNYARDIIITPLSDLVINKLLRLMEALHIQTAAFEYFLTSDVEVPWFIDFNINSNYKKFFLDVAGKDLLAAWIELINDSFNNYETIQRNSITFRHSQLQPKGAN